MKRVRLITIVVLVIAIAFVTLMGSAIQATAQPAFSPDGKTCTPCHAPNESAPKPAPAPKPPVSTPAAPAPAPAATTIPETFPANAPDISSIVIAPALTWDSLWSGLSSQASSN